MKTLIQLTANTELACYEAMALAFMLASFDHQVQLWLTPNCYGVLMQADSRLSGMIKSLGLYDMPKAWLEADVYSGWLVGMLDGEVAAQLELLENDRVDLHDFDGVLNL